MGRFPLQEPVMRRVNLAGFTLLALGLATGLVVVSCQDQRSVTEAPRAPRADAIAGSATAVISPSGDTYLNINAVNAAGEPTLNLYTWPDNKIANAVVMKFGLLRNSAPAQLLDRYRSFSSTEVPVASTHPYLTVVYPPPPAQPTAGQGSLVFPPAGDTYLNINATNSGAEPTLNVYTWPDAKIANAIVMKFDLASIPAGSTISSATLNLNLVESDGMAEPTYTVTAHRIVNKNPDLARATGYTYDGVNSWTPNTCFANNIPLAQADISAPVDTKAIDKTLGFKQWDVTSIVDR